MVELQDLQKQVDLTLERTKLVLRFHNIEPIQKNVLFCPRLNNFGSAKILR